MPSGNEMHMGVYNISERDHIELQRAATISPHFWPISLKRNYFSAPIMFSPASPASAPSTTSSASLPISLHSRRAMADVARS